MSLLELLVAAKNFDPKLFWSKFFESKQFSAPKNLGAQKFGSTNFLIQNVFGPRKEVAKNLGGWSSCN